MENGNVHELNRSDIFGGRPVNACDAFAAISGWCDRHSALILVHEGTRKRIYSKSRGSHRVKKQASVKRTRERETALVKRIDQLENGKGCARELGLAEFNVRAPATMEQASWDEYASALRERLAAIKAAKEDGHHSRQRRHEHP